MTPRQKKFCELYAQNLNASEAARGAGYSVQTAGSIGSENLKKPEIVAYIRELQDQTAALRIAGIKEVKAMLSDTMRDPDVPPAVRIRSAELLLKSAGEFARPVPGKDNDSAYQSGNKNKDSKIILLPPLDPESADDDDEDDGEGREKDYDVPEGWIVIR